MKRHLVMGLMAVAAVGVATPLASQVDGLPIYNNANQGSGIALHADVGLPNTQGGAGQAWIGTGEFGISMIRLTLSGGMRNPENFDSYFTWGGTAAFRVIGGALWPVSVNIQGGIGIGSPTDSLTTKRYTVDVGLGFNVPATGFDVEPWLSGGLRIFDPGLDTGSSVDDTQSDFGIAGGLDISHPGGFGARIAIDNVWMDNDRRVFTVGLGLTYRFRLPAPGL